MTSSLNQISKQASVAQTKKRARILVYSVLIVTVVHTIYMNVMGFNSLSHEGCIVFSNVPRWFFYLYENVFELVIVVVLGVLAGVLIEQYFRKIKRFYPQNQLLAFAYAAVLPICSCGVIPLIDSMKKRTSLKVIITFIIAAPLLNPYIVFVSFTVLGLKYTILRIVSSFLLAIISGWVVEYLSNRFKWLIYGEYTACTTTCNPVLDKDVFVQTMNITKKLLPYIIIAGIFSFLLAIINPKQYLETLSLDHEPWSTILMGLIGIPIYVCNGADVVFLKPLLAYTDLTLGSAMAFSLTSSALCISSIVMLMKFLGKKLTSVLVLTVFVLTLLFSYLINLI